MSVSSRDFSGLWRGGQACCPLAVAGPLALEERGHQVRICDIAFASAPAMSTLLLKCLQRLQGVNQVIKRVAIRVAHPSNLKFPVSGSTWGRGGQGKGRVHSCLLIGPPQDSHFSKQTQKWRRKVASCQCHSLLPPPWGTTVPADVPAAGWAPPQRNISCFLLLGNPGSACEAFWRLFPASPK